MLTKRIRTYHQVSRCTYGAPRIRADLAGEGKRVARLMRVAGLQGVSRRKGPRTTVRRPETRPAPDLRWVADVTYVPTAAGFLYLAVILDVFSRRVVGWKVANHMRTELVLKALEMALSQRRPSQVIHHSDQGLQYTSFAFGHLCRKASIQPSMGSVGDCYDNALCESFFATLECELIDRKRFQNHVEARMESFDFIEGWYNTHRRHSSLDYLSPMGYERKHKLRVSNSSVYLSTITG